MIYFINNFKLFVKLKESFRLNSSEFEIRIGFEEFTSSWQNKLFPSTKDFKIFVLLLRLCVENIRLDKEPIWIILKFLFIYLDQRVKFNLKPS